MGKVVFELSGQAVNFASSAGRCDCETNHSFFPFGGYEAVRKKLRTCLIQIGLEWCRPCDKFAQTEECSQCKHDEACQTETIHKVKGHGMPLVTMMKFHAFLVGFVKMLLL